jgi:hypothetical protein
MAGVRLDAMVDRFRKRDAYKVVLPIAPGSYIFESFKPAFPQNLAMNFIEMGILPLNAVL